MNVTDKEIKYSQLYMASDEAFEDYLQMVSAEQREHAEVYDL
jgi:hypothetical protein